MRPGSYRLWVAAALACATPSHAATPTVCDLAAASAPVPVVARGATPAGDARDCLVDAASLAGAAGRGASLLDARRVDGLRRSWIDGATPVARERIAESLTASDERAVLIGTSRDVRELVDACLALHAQGRTHVRVLAGGIEAWHRAGLPVHGDVAAFARPTFVAAAELRRTATESPALVVFDATADAALRGPGKKHNAAGRHERRADAARRIARELERAGRAPGLDPVLVVLPDRAASAEWTAAWNATPYPNPRFFVGDDADYRSAVDRGERIAADRDKPLPGPCDR